MLFPKFRPIQAWEESLLESEEHLLKSCRKTQSAELLAVWVQVLKDEETSKPVEPSPAQACRCRPQGAMVAGGGPGR